MSRNIDRIIERQRRKKQEAEENRKNLKMAHQSILRDPKMRFHIDRAAQVLFEVAKTQRKKMGSPKDQAKLMQEEMQKKKDEIGMVFDRRHREILKYIKKNK